MTDQPQPETTVAFVLYPGLTPLDLIGPLQVFATLGSYAQLGLPVPPTRTVVVAERLEPMDSDTPVKLVPSATFDQLPDPDIVIVPGGACRRSGRPATRPSWPMCGRRPRRRRCARWCAPGRWFWPRPGCWRAGRPPPTGPTGGCWRNWAPAMSPSSAGWRTASSLPRPGSRPGSTWPCTWSSGSLMRAPPGWCSSASSTTPSPPRGIQWNTVDRDIYAPVIAQQLPATLADKPELLHRLTD